MRIKLYFSFVLALLILPVSYLAAANQQQGEEGPDLNKLVANGFVLPVNGDAISSYDIIQKIEGKLQAIGVSDYKTFYTKAYPLVKDSVMAEIYDILMYQYSKQDMDRQGIDDKVMEDARNKRKNEIIREYGGNEPITNLELEKKGTTMEAELDKYERMMIVSAYRDVNRSSDRTVTRIEMVDYYNRHQDKYTVAGKMQFSLIELDGTLNQAQEILNRLNNGEDFAELAKTVSKGWRAKYGGLWNELDPESIKKQYVPVVEKLKNISVGGLTGIVESEGKYYIARLESYSPASVLPLTEVQDSIKNEIYELRWREYTVKLSAKLLERAIVGDTDGFVAGTIYTAWKKLGGQDTLEK